MKLWVIRYKLLNIIQDCPLSLLSQSLRDFVTQWRHAVASVDRKIGRLYVRSTLIMYVQDTSPPKAVRQTKLQQQIWSNFTRNSTRVR